jgi:gliding motility-associated-like protein
MRKLLLSALFALFSLSMFAQIPAYVPANGLVGWWPFNGNANDESGNGNNGTVNGANLTTDLYSVPNSAYIFSSISNNYIDFQNSIGNFNSDFSIQIWFTINGNPGYLLSKRSDENCTNNWWVISPVGFEICQGPSGNNQMSHGQTFNLNSWHLMTVTRNGTNFRLYVDGILTNNINSIVNYQINNSAKMLAGIVNAPIGGYVAKHNGKIDDIGIWNRALTQCEIKSLFNSAPWLAINDISICPNDTGTVIAQTVENGGAFQWSSGQQTSSINVSIPTTTTYSVAYTLNGLTCTDSAIVTVIPNQTAFFPSVNPICAGDPLAPLPTSSLNLFQGTWSPPLNNLLTTTYTFTPSPNVCVWDTTTLTIVVKPLPILSSQDIIACKGQQVTVVSVPDLPNGVFAWSNNSTASQLNITADTSTFYTVSYTLDGCTSLVDTISVLVNTLPFVSITPNGPTTFCAESSINLSSLSTTGNLWSNGQNAQNITVSASGTYQLIVTDSNGCVDSASIFITNTGITCIQIGGVFTPNGDGTNDTWEIPGIENYPDATVEIFNRWGQQIFYSNGYNSPWNGTYNNERLPTGDYFYIIDLGDGNPLKGALTIKN